jgi:hypothetical protein
MTYHPWIASELATAHIRKLTAQADRYRVAAMAKRCCQPRTAAPAQLRPARPVRRPDPPPGRSAGQPARPANARQPG